MVDLNNLYTRLGRIEALLESIAEKIESGDERMDDHEERLSKVEHHKTSMVAIAATFGSVFGWGAGHLPKFLIAATLALALTAGNAAAQCSSVDEAVAHINSINPIEQHVRLTPGQAAGFVAWFNRQPPQSDDRFSTVIVIRHADGAFGVLLGEGADVCLAFRVPPQLVNAMLDAIVGEGV